jgi:hypothetical protein
MREVKDTLSTIGNSVELIDRGMEELNKQQRQLNTEVNKMAETTATILAEVTAENIKVDALGTAFNNLVANQQPGPGPGQVIVNQSELDAIGAAITGEAAKIPDETPKQ